MRSLEARPDLTISTERLSAALAAERLRLPNPPVVIDVRTPREHEEKFVEGSTSMPLNRLPTKLEQIPRDRPILVYCAGGYRSSIASSLLQQHGFSNVAELAGGIAAWETAKLPVRKVAAAP